MGRVDVYKVWLSVWRNLTAKAIYEVPVGIDNAGAVTVQDVLAGYSLEERRLTGSGAADYVYV